MLWIQEFKRTSLKRIVHLLLIRTQLHPFILEGRWRYLFRLAKDNKRKIKSWIAQHARRESPLYQNRSSVQRWTKMTGELEKNLRVQSSRAEFQVVLKSMMMEFHNTLACLLFKGVYKRQARVTYRSWPRWDNQPGQALPLQEEPLLGGLVS